MGKPFTSELLRISNTLSWSSGLNISDLADFLAKARGKPLLIIGSGGSYTSAEFVQMLFESTGGIAVSATPLRFIQNQSYLRGTNILLITAGGNNRDILAAFDCALRREADSVFIICGALNSKIEKLAANTKRANLLGLDLPAGKDGYLATNSLVAFTSIAIRAFGYELPQREWVQNFIGNWDRRWDQRVTPYYLALYSDWSKPAAVDLESKFSEAGLGAVLLADYRNFAHGRHNWIDKNGADSTILAFISSKESHNLAKKTFKLLPAETRSFEFHSESHGPTAGLELIIQVFCFTAFVGRLRGIDPGRPGVPDYGSRLYRLGPGKKTSRRELNQLDLRLTAVHRKQDIRGTLGCRTDQACLERAFDAYCNSLQKARFGALVVDFDGTVADPGAVSGRLHADIVSLFSTVLRNRIPIYFATGRGDSLHRVIEESFPEAIDKIYISYYNGAFTLPFSEAHSFKESPILLDLNATFHAITQDPLLSRLTEPKNKGSQITLRLSQGSNARFVYSVVAELVERVTPTRFRVVLSSHSIDVIPISCTKLNCIGHAEKNLRSSLRVLAIGDRGAKPGNDFELLTHPFSLSVDEVSSDMNSCWNILPPGVRNREGIVHYGEWIRAFDGYFQVLLPNG